MSNPLLAFWYRLFNPDGQAQAGRAAAVGRRVPMASTQASVTFFLVLRRMRAPLIILITIFAVSVLGLTLIPGRDAAGQPWRMSFFDAFYVMSYTATTIGYGEIPYAFSAAQRLWVTISIYLTVIGWAYAIGSLLSLLQDRQFRQAWALQRFQRTVTRLREPFLLMAGYGQTGELLGQSLDALGRRFVVLDSSENRIAALDLGSYRSDVPGLAGDARNPSHLGAAGLGHPRCEGVLALTNDDEANLAVTMTSALLRPDLPVIARTVSRTISASMSEFSTPTVINPFDRFGYYLGLSLRAPATYQLLTWLTSVRGTELPTLRAPLRRGRWVICGYGRFGRELTADLRAQSLEVAVVDPQAVPDDDGLVFTGTGTEEAVLRRAGLVDAVGFVAATDDDMTNLALIAAARHVHPALFVVARQNEPASSELFASIGVDALLVPTELVAREAFARLVTPLLWSFLEALPAQGDAWAAALVERLRQRCGRYTPEVWKVQVIATEAPAVFRRLGRGPVRVGDLMRHPEDRDEGLRAVPLMVARGPERHLEPDDDFGLHPHDELLLAGRSSARRALDATLFLDASLEYVVSGRLVPSGWVWRRLSRHSQTRTERADSH